MIEIKRVKYRKQPLVEVICQLRFPTILSINANDPVSFQDEIRENFPYYKKIVNEKEFVLNNENRSLIKETNHEFINVSKKTKINLTSSFLAISSLEYDRWEKFKEVVCTILQVLEKVYKPAFYTRVGLRYKDVIDRKRLGIPEKGWVELIKPNILGIIDKTNQTTIKQWSVKSEYQFADSDIATKQIFYLAEKNDEDMPVMVFDCDYFKGGLIPLQDIGILTDRLHEKSSVFLRNAITEELHNVMEPQEL